MRLLTRNDYESKIFQYKKRRDVFKEKYGFKTPEYNKAIKKINRKIKIWRRGMFRIGKRAYDNPVITPRRLAYYLKDFTGVEIRNIGRGQKANQMEAKWLFSKWGMENRIVGTRLSEYMGCQPKRASELRLKFTRSFNSHPSHRELYQAFCNYIRENEEENQLNRVE